MPHPVNGIFLLNKPSNMTSNAALQKVKRLFNAKKAGHTGSLDPIATGMLPICFGEATKFSQFLLESDKSYHVVAKLGVKTTTGDCEGEVIATKPLGNISFEHIQNVMKEFIGPLEQIPPMYSAIKFQGNPLYKLARAGIEIERKPRSIHIFSLDLQKLEEDQFSFQVHCSKGTYIRTLVEDITHQLGCGGHVLQLNRLMVTPYQHTMMHSLSDIEKCIASGVTDLSHFLLPVETAVQVFPIVKLNASSTFYLRMGQSVRANFPIDATFVRLVSEDNKFLGIGERMLDGRIKPHRLIATQ